MKITVVCGNGLGTSLMMEMSIKNIVKELGVAADVDHVDLGSAKGTDSDIFCRYKRYCRSARRTGGGGKNCLPE